MEISEDQPNAKAIYSELGMERVSHPSLTFWQRDSKTGRGMGKVDSGKKGRLHVCPHWRLLARGSCRKTD